MLKKGFKIFFLVFLSLILTFIVTYKIMNLRTFQFFGEIIYKINTDKKVVALTFDDGPNENTDEILKILKENNVKATFFLTGVGMKNNIGLTKEIIENGHGIGNHTFNHKRMIFVSYSFVKKELEDTDKIIRDCGYKGDIYFRPPNCKKLFVLPYYLNKNNRLTFTWNIESDSIEENRKNPELIKRDVDLFKGSSWRKGTK
jgi:chitin deacetylase